MQSNNLPAMAYYPPFSPQPEFEPETPAVPLSHYLWILRRHLLENGCLCGLLCTGDRYSVCAAATHL